jgi:hypothetical protein
MDNQQTFDLRPLSVFKALWADMIDIEPQNQMLEPLYVIWDSEQDVVSYILIK